MNMEQVMLHVLHSPRITENLAKLVFSGEEGFI